MQLHPEVAHLADLLHRIEDHLTTHDAGLWAEMINRCRASVEQSDASGLNRLLAMFGGMGSLNDAVLQRDGKMFQSENDELRRMLSEAWMLAAKLQRDEIAPTRSE